MSQLDVFTTMPTAKPGDHFCFLYDNEHEHQTVLTRYLQEGLQQNQKVVYVTEAHTAGKILGYLEEIGWNATPYLSTGQLQIISYGDAYLREGNFNPDKMLDLLRAETERALLEGYAALRATGEVGWITRASPGSERFIEYERKVNSFCSKNAFLGLCQYDRRLLPSEILVQALSSHPSCLCLPRQLDRGRPHLVPVNPQSGWTKNILLNALPRTEYLRLSRNLERVYLNKNDVLYEGRGRVSNVFFPEESQIAIFVEFSDGKSVKVAEVGNGGLLGVQLALGGNTSARRAVVQVGGNALRISADRFTAELGRSPILREIILNYIRTLIVNISEV